MQASTLLLVLVNTLKTFSFSGLSTFDNILIAFSTEISGSVINAYKSFPLTSIPLGKLLRTSSISSRVYLTIPFSSFRLVNNLMCDSLFEESKSLAVGRVQFFAPKRC